MGKQGLAEFIPSGGMRYPKRNPAGAVYTDRVVQIGRKMSIVLACGYGVNHATVMNHFELTKIVASKRSARDSKLIADSAVQRCADRFAIYGEFEQHTVRDVRLSRRHLGQPILGSQLAGNGHVDARKIVDEPVGAGGERHFHAHVEITVKRVLKGAVIAAVEDILSMHQAANPVRNVFVSECVVTPDDRRAVVPRGADAALQRNAVGPFFHDPRADADRLNSLQNVEQHDVSKTFAAGAEIVPMFLAVAE